MELTQPVRSVRSVRTHRWLLRAAVVVGVVGFIAAVVTSGVLGRFSDQEELRSTIDTAGVWGCLLYTSDAADE